MGIRAYGRLTNFRDFFEVVMRESLRRHFTIVFDEFQNLYKVNPAIFSEMQELWDRKGENEIDMIALNEFDHTGIAAEIKRNPRKISLTELERKVSNLPSAGFGCYHLTLQTLSLEDL